MQTRGKEVKKSKMVADVIHGIPPSCYVQIDGTDGDNINDYYYDQGILLI